VKLHHRLDLFLDGGEVEGRLIADLQMPEMTGLELQLALARRGVQIPIIITAHDEAGMRERCRSAGAIAYMAKPVSDTSLFAAIDAAGKRPGG
jgi:two-component system, LuxR family, response regulator FixJ